MKDDPIEFPYDEHKKYKKVMKMDLTQPGYYPAAPVEGGPKAAEGGALPQTQGPKPLIANNGTLIANYKQDWGFYVSLGLKQFDNGAPAVMVEPQPLKFPAFLKEGHNPFSKPPADK